MTELLEILNEIKPGVDFKNCTTLVDDGILDSLDIITIISEISDEYDVRIAPDQITNDNFNSATAIKALIDSLLDD